MIKRKTLHQLFDGKNSSSNSVEDKKEIEAYLKKIQDKLKNDPQAQKKAAMIISLMLGDELQHKSKSKKAI